MDSKGFLRADLIRVCFITLIALLASGSARAQGSPTVRYVASNSVTDGPACGSLQWPCRSISQAVANANDGDAIEVGPGLYGDINADGDATDFGEEPSVDLDKPITVYSQAGAHLTTIRAPLSPQLRTNIVRIFISNVTFGRPRGGFTVVGDTSEVGEGSEGILVAGLSGMSGNVTISDNIVVDNTAGGVIIQVPAHTSTGDIVVRRNLATRNALGFAIEEGTFPAGRVRLEDNIAFDNEGLGFFVSEFAHASRIGPGHVLRGNVATRNRIGFSVRSSSNSLIGNQAVANEQVGIEVRSGGNEISGNSVIANAVAGFRVFANTGTPVIRQNNIYSNGEAAGGCGLINEGAEVDATGNYWGKATGPGPNPGDRAHGACVVAGRTTALPFSSTAFPIAAPAVN